MFYPVRIIGKHATFRLSLATGRDRISDSIDYGIEKW
jgi:hypothetical protein